MKTSLESAKKDVKNLAHATIVAVGIVGSLYLNACHDNPVTPQKNSPPNSTLEVSPLSGISPLEVRIKGSATDPDGLNDIASYEIRAGDYILTKNPTDTTLVFYDPFSVNSKVVDRKGAEDKKGPINVQVLHASVSQNAQLQNKVDIKYEANLSNISQATLEVMRNNQTIFTRNITTLTYSETFPNMLKGNYDFVLSWRDTSDRKSVQVPNYLPDADFSGLQADMDEGAEINLNLESRLENADPNPEDNPVALADVVPLDDKTQPSVNGKNINIKSLPDKVGSYAVAVQIGSDAGGKNTETLNAMIYDLFDIQGFLEDSEKHLRQPGIIKVYDSNDVKIGEIQVDNSGQFNKRFNQRVADLTDIILIQGRKIDPLTEQEQSYIRTIKLTRGDVNGLVMRVVPYDGLAEHGITPEDFSRHMREVLTADGTNGKGIVDALTLDPIIYKWKEVPEIIIPRVPYDLNVPAFFNDTARENTKKRIQDTEDIGAWYGGKKISAEKIEFVEFYDVSLPGQEGRLVIYPWNNVNQGFFLDFNQDGYIDFGQTKNSVNTNGEIISAAAECHEVGHAAGMGTNGSGAHALTLTQDESIMVPFLININYYTPRFADKKTAKVINEDSYIHGQGRDSDGLLKVNDILGLKFLDEQ
jgi:hypothetical protein